MNNGDPKAGTSVSVITLGTGTAIPDAERGPTATLLRNGGYTVLIDCGSGTLQKLAKAGVSLLELDALVLTHAHLDHIADLFPLLFALYVPGFDRVGPLPIYLSDGTMRRIRQVQDAFGNWLKPEGAVCWHLLAPGDSTAIGPWLLRTAAVRHDTSSIGLRFEEQLDRDGCDSVGANGAIVAIPGDSGPCPSLSELCASADVALLECSLPDTIPLDSHLTPSQVIDVIGAARPATVLIVHRYPEALAEPVIEQIAAATSAKIVAAADGQEFVIR